MRRTIRENIEIKIDLASEIEIIMADVGQIEQVIMNLAVNAADAMSDGGRLIIETAKVKIDENYASTHQGVYPGDYVMLSMSDTGCGMDAEVCDHIFEPFFSTKGELGTGLGLSTVYGIVKQHKGHIWTYTEPGIGTTFKVYIPISGTQRVEKKDDKEMTANLSGSETILLVEDNDQVRTLTKAVLERKGYSVLVAENGTEALKIIDNTEDSIQLLLTDVVMPKMNGHELFSALLKKYPKLKVLYMSGYTNNMVNSNQILDEGVQFIQKPFNVQALALKVREALNR